VSRVLDEGPDDYEPPQPQHPMRPTDWRTVGLLLIAGLLLGWFSISLLGLFDVSLPVTPWVMSSILALLGIVAIIGGQRLSARRRHGQAPDGQRMVAILAGGRAALVTGLLVAGSHLVYVLAQMPRVAVPLNAQRAIAAGAAVVAGMIFAAGGWMLERACRISEDDKGRRRTRKP